MGAGPARSEFLYNRTSTGSTTSTPTCRAAQSSFVGADTRPRWTSSGSTATRIHQANPIVRTPIVLKNQNDGRVVEPRARSAERPLTQRSLAEDAPTATASRRTPWIPARSRSVPGTTTSTRAIRTTPAIGYAIRARPAIASSSSASYTQRVLRLRRNDRVGLLGEPHDRQHQLHIHRRPERRWRHQQRPDLHPARHLGDELPDLCGRRRDVHGGRAGAGLGPIHRERQLPRASIAASTPSAAPCSCRWCIAPT